MSDVAPRDDALADAIDTDAIDTEGTGGAPWADATYRPARIPEARAAEYVERMQQLAPDFVDEPRGGDVEFGRYLAVFPVDRGGDDDR